MLFLIAILCVKFYLQHTIHVMQLVWLKNFKYLKLDFSDRKYDEKNIMLKKYCFHWRHERSLVKNDIGGFVQKIQWSWRRKYFQFYPYFCTAIANESKKLYGVQFHPEVDLTENGKIMMKNFLFEVCKLKADYTMKSREDECIAEIRKQIKDNKVLVRKQFNLLVVKVLPGVYFSPILCPSSTQRRHMYIAIVRP